MKKYFSIKNVGLEKLGKIEIFVCSIL